MNQDEKIHALQSAIDRSKLQLELARVDGADDAAQWHAELIRAAKAELAAAARLDAARMTQALAQRSARTMQAPAGPLFGTRGLFDQE